MDQATHPPEHAAHPDPACPHCLVKPRMARSAKFAWALTGLTVTILVAVLVLGAQSRAGFLTGTGGLFLIMLLACPVMMGGVMWMMMRMGH